MSNPIEQFSELLSSPLGDLISSIGRGVGEAQAALDAGSLAQTLDIYREYNSNNNNNNANSDAVTVRTEDEKRIINLMREIGYQPTFYTIPETECEAQVSLSLGIVGQQNQNPMQSGYYAKTKMFTTPLNAGNINRYNLNAQASAKLKFKIIPVPTDALIAEIRILPNLVGMSFTNAKALLNALGLNYSLPTGINENDIQNNNITQTDPVYEENNEKRLKVGDVVRLDF